MNTPTQTSFAELEYASKKRPNPAGKISGGNVASGAMVIIVSQSEAALSAKWSP
jgi:hypothetical protein